VAVVVVVVGTKLIKELAEHGCGGCGRSEAHQRAR
jgi:hypothetical protein